MKFVCDQCKTKYSIDDTRVRGKVLKIRCKQCDHVITVREETAARATGPQAAVVPTKALERALDASFNSGGGDFDNSDRTQISNGIDIDALVAASRSSARAAPKSDGEWFVSFDGVQEGPFALDKLAARVKAERGKEAHAWRQGYDGWLPVADVPEIARLLRSPTPPAGVRVSVPTPAAGMRVATPAPKPSTARPATPMRPTGPTSVPSSTAAMAKSGARPSGADHATMLERPAPAMASGGVRHSPAASFAAAAAQSERVPSIDTTPAPLPAPPVVERAPARKPVQPPIPAAASPLAARSAEGAVAAAAAPAAPAPLPPRNGIDLLISEPSLVTQLPVASNGHSSAPAPVVIITGPAARGAAPWLRFALLGGGVVIIALLGTVGYLVYGRRPEATAVAPPQVVEKGVPIDDKPAGVADNAPVMPPHPPVAAALPVAAKSDARLAPKKSSTKPASSKPNLSGNQSALASLYGDTEKTSSVRDLPSVTRAAPKDVQVSETQLADVVRKNKQSLTICYDRVLKRDNQLKNARIDVDVKIGISGSVTRVNMPQSYAGSEIAVCLSQAIKRWHFPALDAEYGTSFPLLLQAQ